MSPKKYLSFLFILFFLTNCETSGPKATNLSGSLIDLPPLLKVYSGELKGNFIVYDKSGNEVVRSSLNIFKPEQKFSVSFIDNLPKGQVFRYVISFNNGENIDLCYLQFIEAVSNEKTTIYTVKSENFICTPEQSSPAINTDLGIIINSLPNIDQDGDTFSNLVELMYGTNYQSPLEYPQGPTLQDFKAELDVSTSQFHITGKILDPFEIKEVHFMVGGVNDITKSIPLELVHNKEGGWTDLKGELNPQLLPLNESELTIKLSNELGLQSLLKQTVSTPDIGENIGPVIIAENLTEGMSISQSTSLSFYAYDRDGVSEIQFINPDQDSISDLVHTSERISGEWDSSREADGIYIIKVRAVDNKGKESLATYSVNITNGTDVVGPKIKLRIFKTSDLDPANEFSYGEGEVLYGHPTLYVEASDPSGVSSLALNNSNLSHDIHEPEVHTNTVYKAQMDIWDPAIRPYGYVDLHFIALDTLGNRSELNISIPFKFALDILSTSISTPLNSQRVANISWTTVDADRMNIYYTSELFENSGSISDDYFSTYGTPEDAFLLEAGLPPTGEIRRVIPFGKKVYFVAIKDLHSSGAFGGIATEKIKETRISFTDDSDQDGFPDRMDCAPNESRAWSGKKEVCDEIDNDCDGSIDENGPCNGNVFWGGGVRF